MKALEVVICESRQKKTTTEVFALKENLHRDTFSGRSSCKISPKSFGQRLCGLGDLVPSAPVLARGRKFPPASAWETRFI